MVLGLALGLSPGTRGSTILAEFWNGGKRLSAASHKADRQDLRITGKVGIGSEDRPSSIRCCGADQSVDSKCSDATRATIVASCGGGFVIVTRERLIRQIQAWNDCATATERVYGSSKSSA